MGLVLGLWKNTTGDDLGRTHFGKRFTFPISTSHFKLGCLA